MAGSQQRGGRPGGFGRRVRTGAHDLGQDTARAEHALPGWLRPHSGENRLPAATAIALAVALQLLLPDRFGLRPRWLAPTIELALSAALVAANPVRLSRQSTVTRYGSLLLVIVLTVDNAASAVLLDRDILTGRTGDNAIGLLGAAAVIYLTNIVAFGIWFWEIDRGGPVARAEVRSRDPDFLFPQMSTPQVARPDWHPSFGDYLYVSFTNATAFSPTDTMPLSLWAKFLMAMQAAVALSTTALVVARAVNVLNG